MEFNDKLIKKLIIYNNIINIKINTIFGLNDVICNIWMPNVHNYYLEFIHNKQTILIVIYDKKQNISDIVKELDNTYYYNKDCNNLRYK
jgi:hypothetical protein